MTRSRTSSGISRRILDLDLHTMPTKLLPAVITNAFATVGKLRQERPLNRLQPPLHRCLCHRRRTQQVLQASLVGQDGKIN